MRASRSVVVTFLVVASTTPALAADHQMKVDEVLLSKGGSTTKQFVELNDPGESFPSPPYGIQVWSAAGVAGAQQALTIASGTTRIVAATAAARTDYTLTVGTTGTTSIVDLTVTLPTDGTLCFTRGTGSTPQLIHCLSWGTVTSLPPMVTAGITSGPAPGDGESLQRVPGCAVPGTPTPNAANSVLCPAPMPDAGPSTPDASTPDAGDVDPPPTGNSGDGGCSTSGGSGWLAFALVALIVRRRQSR